MAEGFPGVLTLLEKEYATATDPAEREALESFRGPVVCHDCGGARLRPEARSVRFADRKIHEITALTIGHAREFFRAVTLDEEDQPIGAPLLAEISKRLEFLDKVGVNYLTLDRPADTLSGGELQRVRLATGIGSGLVGVCYVLDEPSIGLHPRDNQRLIDALRDLQQQGNTVLVVEHDEAMMRQADRLIDMGPGAGQHGGQIVAQGTPAEVAANPDFAHRSLPVGRAADRRPRQRGASTTKTRAITIEGVTTNNLKKSTRTFPLGALVCVTGVSGSGKSSLVNETLVQGGRPQAQWQRSQARPVQQPARRESDRQAGADRSIADRPHAAQQSGHVHRRVRRNSQSVRRHARGPAARLQGRPLQLQRQGRPLRGMPGAGQRRSR